MESEVYTGAFDGVYPRAMIRLASPGIGDEEVRAVERVLRSGMLVQGPEVARFEEGLRERCGRTHAVAVSSGTTALELALEALGVGPGDDVLVPDLTWPSPGHAVRRVGARPVLVDVDPAEWNASPQGFAAARTEATRAAVVVDQFGFPARHEAIAAALPGVTLVEDAACAIGSSYQGRPCGSRGAVACLSFHPRKVVTTGEGGACLTDDDELAGRLRVMRNHGIAGPGRFARAAGNHRLTEMAAAMGSVQLGRLDDAVGARRERARRYHEGLPMLTWQRPAPGAEPNYQTMGALLPPGGGEAGRDRLIAELRARGIEVGLLSYALHRQPSLEGAGGGPFPNAEQIADRGVALPLHSRLSMNDQDLVIEALRTLL